MAMARPTVVVTRALPEAVEAVLGREFDARLNGTDSPMDEAALREAFQFADAVVPTIGDRLTAAVLARPVRARILANYGVGTDHIDIAAAKEGGLVVTNTPGVLTDCTADLTLALMLATMRRIGEGERELRRGDWTGWRPTHLTGTRVSGKVLGIIGFGRIGLAVARRAHYGFGMRILFHTPRPPAHDVCAALGARRRSLDELLEESDVVSLHAPAVPATRHMIGAAQLSRMRPHAFLINTSRGDLVDESALIDALRGRRIAGAGLDVHDNEPAIRADWLDLPNVVLLPHMGSASVETRTAMGLRAVENLRAFFAGRPPPDRVA